MSISKLGALIHSHPEEARTKIMGALEVARGDRQAAAKTLATTHRSLYRFIDRLDLWDAIDAMVREKGFPHIPGPPRSREKLREAVLDAGGNLAKAAHKLNMDKDVLEEKLSAHAMWAGLNEELVRRGRRPMRVPEAAEARA